MDPKFATRAQIGGGSAMVKKLPVLYCLSLGALRISRSGSSSCDANMGTLLLRPCLALADWLGIVPFLNLFLSVPNTDSYQIGQDDRLSYLLSSGS